MKILGLGNALVDIMTKLKSDKFLEDHNLPKGSMQLVDFDLSEAVLKDAGELEKSLSSGGSAANTINGLSRLGVQCGYVGSVGNDEFGDFFKNDLIKNNVSPLLFEGKQRTGRAIALISPDSERTFATYLGAATELEPDLITEDIFKGYDILHTEGYLVFNNQLIKKVAETAKKAGLLVSLDLSSYNIVEQNKEFLHNLITEFIDFVFANEVEAKAFTGEAPDKALEIISGISDYAIVKTGAKGSLIKYKDRKYSIDPINASPIDATGAGDLYAAGFFYGLANNLPIEKCGKAGSILAGNVIEVVGSKMDDNRWEQVISRINQL
ncbi:MAG: adenosine kinase [Marinilabiliales bacterium]